MRIGTTVAVIAAALSTTLAPAAVHKVNSLATLQAAIAVAADGDVILVQSGTYLDCNATVTIAGKGLSIMNDDPVKQHICRVVISNIPATSTVVLRGLKLGPHQLLVLGLPLRIDAGAGAVWVEECEIQGDEKGILCGTIFGSCAGEDGVRVADSMRVVFANCVVEGGFGLSNGISGTTFGGVGLYVEKNAHVVSLGTQVHGGDVQNIGITIPGIAVYAAGSGPTLAFHGGTLIGGAESPAGTGQNLGLVASFSTVSLRDTTIQAPYTPKTGDSVFPAPARHVATPIVLREGQTGTLSVVGQPGDQAFLFVSTSPSAPAFVEYAVHQGSVLFDGGAFIGPAFAGTISASGSLAIPVTAPAMPAGLPDGIGAIVQLVTSSGSSVTLDGASAYTQVRAGF